MTATNGGRRRPARAVATARAAETQRRVAWMTGLGVAAALILSAVPALGQTTDAGALDPGTIGDTDMGAGSTLATDPDIDTDIAPDTELDTTAPAGIDTEPGLRDPNLGADLGDPPNRYFGLNEDIGEVTKPPVGVTDRELNVEGYVTEETGTILNEEERLLETPPGLVDTPEESAVVPGALGDGSDDLVGGSPGVGMETESDIGEGGTTDTILD